MHNSLDLIATLIHERNGSSTSQIARALKLAIDQGVLPPGTTLPSARELARKLGVSRSTTHRSFQTLSSQGYIKSSTGQASRVQNPILKSRVRSTPSEQFVLDCSPQSQTGSGSEVPTPTVMEGEFLNLYDPSVVARIRLLLTDYFRELYIGEYDDVSVGMRLCQALSDYLFRSRLVRSTKYDIEILSSQSARIELLTALLIDFGARIAVAADADEGLVHRLHLHGSVISRIGCDRSGMQTDLLCRGEDAPSLVYVTPSRGAVLSVERRRQLLEWASSTGSLIVEDDCDSFKSSGVDSLPSIQSFDADGRVLYLPAPPVRFIPFLRICAVVLSPKLMQPFLTLKKVADPNPPCFEQLIFSDLLESGQFETMLLKSRTRQLFTADVQNDCATSAQFEAARELYEGVSIADDGAPFQNNPRFAGFVPT